MACSVAAAFGPRGTYSGGALDFVAAVDCALLCRRSLPVRHRAPAIA
jgi:hypothetical protein